MSALHRAARQIHRGGDREHANRRHGGGRRDGGGGSSGDHGNHGQYVSCVAHAAQELVDAGLITQREKAGFVREAAQAD